MSSPVLTAIIQALTIENKGSEELFVAFEQQITTQKSTIPACIVFVGIPRHLPKGE